MIRIGVRLDDLSQPGRTLPEHTPYTESGSAGWKMVVRTPLWQPPTDVYETEELLVVRMEIAGMNEDHFLIELDGQILSVRGSRLDANERRAYHQMEIRFGEFNLEIELPAPIDPDQVSASYQEGFLKILLPKMAPRHIHIEE